VTDKEGCNREMRPEGQKFVVLGSEIETYHIHQKESKCFYYNFEVVRKFPSYLGYNFSNKLKMGFETIHFH